MVTETKSNPWDQDWGSGTSYLKEVPKTEVSTTPWNDDWGSGVSYLKETPQAASGKPQGPSNDPFFDQVVERLIHAESRGRHRASSGKLLESPKGARGITQVMPATGASPGFGVKPLQNDSEEEYVRFGRDYLSAMLQKYEGDYELALAAYNAGPGNVDKAVKSGGSQWKKFLPKGEETLPYISSIMRGMNGS